MCCRSVLNKINALILDEFITVSNNSTLYFILIKIIFFTTWLTCTFGCTYVRIYTKSNISTEWFIHWDTTNGGKFMRLIKQKENHMKKRVLIHFVGFIFSQYIPIGIEFPGLYIYAARAIYFPNNFFFSSSSYSELWCWLYAFFFGREEG